MKDGARPQRAEPRGMTLIDLSALVLGCAVGIPLIGLTGPAVARSPLELLMNARSVLEGLQLLCLALTPVVFVRRVRYGGPVRPTEVLPCFFAMPLLAWASQELVGEVDANGDGTIVWWWEYLSAVASPVLFGSFELFQKKLSGWASVLLLTLGAFTFWVGGEMYLSLTFRAWESLNLPPFTSELAGFSLAVLVISVMYGIPLAKSLLDRPRRQWTWAESAGFGLGTVLSLFAVVVGIHELLSESVFARHKLTGYLVVTAFLLALALSVKAAAFPRTKARLREPTSESP